MVEKTSSEKLRDIFDIKIKMSSEEARRLALEGRLPDNVEVDGDLDLEATEITLLPSNLLVGGNLYLRNTKITSLQGCLTVCGGVDLGDTKITSLPEKLEVGLDLDLRGTSIASLPEGITVSGDVFFTKELKNKKPKGVKGRLLKGWVD